MTIKIKLFRPALLTLLFSILILKSFGQAATAVVRDSAADSNLEKLRKDVEADPNNIEKIKAYISAASKEQDLLPLQLDKWKRMFPASRIIQVLAQRMPVPVGGVVLDSLRRAIEADPDNLDLHETYIRTVGFGQHEQELIKQYDAWMKQFPKSPAVPYAMAETYVEMESPKAKPYLLKTVAVDPKYAKAWSDLWIDAQRWGDFTQSTDYLLKAVNADPSNSDYAFHYATSFEGLDQNKFTALSLKVARQFSNTETGARALGYLASRLGPQKDRLKYFQLLQDSFPPDKAAGYRAYYFDLLLGVDPGKAKSLAAEMENVQENMGVNWVDLGEQATNIINGKKLLELNKAGEALAVFKRIKLPLFCIEGAKAVLLLRAEATDQTGEHSAAYDTIMKAFLKEPSPALQKALYRYGKEAGKTEAAVKTDIYNNLATNAKQATPFTLKKYIGGGNASLSDYKGKVLLLTYWFPGCGPCRAEMPFFEDVVRQYKNKPLAYVGINIVRGQDDYVIPFHKNSGFSFTPLAESDERQKGNLDNHGQAPVNFLIDQNGRIIFSDFSIHAANEADLKLMIDLLLNAPDEFRKNI